MLGGDAHVLSRNHIYIHIYPPHSSESAERKLTARDGRLAGDVLPAASVSSRSALRRNLDTLGRGNRIRLTRPVSIFVLSCWLCCPRVTTGALGRGAFRVTFRVYATPRRAAHGRRLRNACSLLQGACGCARLSGHRHDTRMQSTVCTQTHAL